VNNTKFTSTSTVERAGSVAGSKGRIDVVGLSDFVEQVKRSYRRDVAEPTCVRRVLM
jgi:hypothetical protein